MGGQVWSGEGIDTYIAGTYQGTMTTLVAGMGPEQAQQLDKLNRGIEEANTHITHLLEKFGLTHIDVGQIRNMIAASTGPRRKILAKHAQQLGQLIQGYQKLLTARKQLEEQLNEALQQAAIMIRDSAFPGVQIRLGPHQRTLSEAIKNPNFRIVDGKLVER